MEAEQPQAGLGVQHAPVREAGNNNTDTEPQQQEQTEGRAEAARSWKQAYGAAWYSCI